MKSKPKTNAKPEPKKPESIQIGLRVPGVIAEWLTEKVRETENTLTRQDIILDYLRRAKQTEAGVQ